MKNLITAKFATENNQAVVSSRIVAEDFGKKHFHVLRDIETILNNPDLDSSTFFIESEYIQSNGKKNPEYLMTRDGFTLLAMGFNGTKAMKFKLTYIDAFNKMEEKIKESLTPHFSIPQTFSEALKLAAEQQEQIELMAPKAEYHDVATEGTWLDATNIVIGLGLTDQQIYPRLRELGICEGYYKGKSKQLLNRITDKYQWLIDEGYCRYGSKSQRKIQWNKNKKQWLTETLSA